MILIFGEIYGNLMNYFNSINGKHEEENVLEEEKTEENSQQNDVNVVNEESIGGAEISIEEVYNENTENIIENETENLSQEEIDIKAIKETTSFIKPVEGVISSMFGPRNPTTDTVPKNHTGIDIAAKSGTAVKCFADGKVLEAKYNDTYGNYVLIEHSNGIRSFYGHNSKLNVKRGASVKKGQKIAEVGTTGLSTGPHLHFEVRNGNKRLDPTHYIKI